MHLAELNISKWKIPATSQAARGFVDYVSRVNGVAERSEGFVWRLLDEQRDETGRNAICPDSDTVMTMSVWETPGHLEEFVWKTVHKRIYDGKDQWFEQMESHHVVFWWVDEGHTPSLFEAKERLDHLDANGDSDFAFGWSHLSDQKFGAEKRFG
ncbi:MAG: DUF3291 domain-containing protein [Pseudomonadota bacterium]